MNITLREWLHSEPFTLSMSSGFFSFFAHSGMLSVLEEEGILPAKITGSSAGALVGACWASGCSASELKERLFRLDKKDFWDPSVGLGFLKGDKFRTMVASVCKVDSLEACRVPVVLSVFDLLSLKTHTLSQGPIARSVSASCAFPFMFQPVRLNKGLYLDGGIKDRSGMASVQEGERVFYHHIASRSPWRLKNSPALRAPEGPNMQVLVINNLPRVNPDALGQGKVAFDVAVRETRVALDKVVC